MTVSDRRAVADPALCVIVICGFFVSALLSAAVLRLYVALQPARVKCCRALQDAIGRTAPVNAAYPAPGAEYASVRSADTSGPTRSNTLAASSHADATNGSPRQRDLTGEFSPGTLAQSPPYNLCGSGSSGFFQPGPAESQPLVEALIDLPSVLLWASRVHNPLNDLVASMIVVQLLGTATEAVAAVITLAKGSSVTCAAATGGSDSGSPSSLFTLSLSVHLCDASATLDQFLNAYTLSMLCMFMATAAFESWCCRAAQDPSRWLRTAHAACLCVAVLTTVVMWTTLPRQPWGSRFAPSMPWCWVPPFDASGDISDGELDALRSVLSYAVTVVALGLGVIGVRNMRARFDMLTTRRYHGKLPKESRVLAVRLGSQLAWLLIRYGMGIVARFSTAHHPIVDGVSAMLFALSAGGNALVWAYGEGVLGVCFGRGQLETAVAGFSFSQVVMLLYGATELGARQGVESPQPPPPDWAFSTCSSRSHATNLEPLRDDE